MTSGDCRRVGPDEALYVSLCNMDPFDPDINTLQPSDDFTAFSW